MAKVKFVKTVEAEGKGYLPDVAKKAKIKIKTPCDGKGTCGKCLVKISKGKVSPPTSKELKKLGEAKILEGYRLACQVNVLEEDVTVKLQK